MRILTFTSLFPNTVQPLLGVFVYQRTAHLVKRAGNQVVVVAPVPYFPSWLRVERWHGISQVPKHEHFGRLEVYHPRYLLVPKISMPLHGLLMFLGSLPVLLRLKKSVGFDCIDAHFVYPDGFAAVLLGKILRVPVIVSARGTDINLYLSFWLIRRMIRWTLRHSASVLAVSSALKEAMQKLGLPGVTIHVVPNGVDARLFRPMPRAEARRQLGLQLDGQLAVSVASLIPSKGHHLLIHAFQELAPRHPFLQLYIVGEGPNRPRLEKLVREAGLQQRVQFVGGRPQEELRLWFNAADISCLMSAREGHPNVVLESLACGTPVLATTVGGIPEIIVSPDLGMLVDQDVSAIAAGLEMALSKDWDREMLSRHAHARTWEAVAERVEEQLAFAIARAGNPWVTRPPQGVSQERDPEESD